MPTSVSEYTFQHGYSNPTRLDTEDINYYNDAYYNAFFQLQEKAWKRHYFIQPILIRYALTLYDGAGFFHRLRSGLFATPHTPSSMKHTIEKFKQSLLRFS